MGVNKVDLSTGETLIDLSNDTVTPETLAEGETAHNAAGEQIVGTMPTEDGESSDALYIVNAVGTLNIDFETLLVTPAEIVSVDRSVAEIIEAAQDGKLVYMSLDASESWINQIGIETDLKLFLPVTVSNSVMDIVFGGLFDISGCGIPVVVRIVGNLLEDTWACSTIPIATVT